MTWVLAGLLPLVGSVPAQENGAPDPAAPPLPAAAEAPDLEGAVRADGRFARFLAMLDRAGMMDVLHQPEVTMLLPTDLAIARLPAGAERGLQRSVGVLGTVVLGHVTDRLVRRADLDAGRLRWFETLSQRGLLVERPGADRPMRIGPATVLGDEIVGHNGVGHAVDTLILPVPSLLEFVTEQPAGKELAALLQAGELTAGLADGEPFTLLLPVSGATTAFGTDAWQRVLRDRVRAREIGGLHLLPGRLLLADLPISDQGRPVASVPTVAGPSIEVRRYADGGVRLGPVRVLQQDLVVGNGVVHIVAEVLRPPPAEEATPPAGR